MSPDEIQAELLKPSGPILTQKEVDILFPTRPPTYSRSIPFLIAGAFVFVYLSGIVAGYLLAQLL